MKLKVLTPKTPLQESVDEIQEWQKTDSWEKKHEKTEKTRDPDKDVLYWILGYMSLVILAIIGTGCFMIMNGG
jgi:hypothetical protein